MAIILLFQAILWLDIGWNELDIDIYNGLRENGRKIHFEMCKARLLIPIS